MGVNSLPKTVTRQRRGPDLNPGPSAPESSTLTEPSYPDTVFMKHIKYTSVLVVIRNKIWNGNGRLGDLRHLVPRTLCSFNS